MSKVICDVCGTVFPETAVLCPICGSAKNTSQQTAAGGDAGDSAAYAYVKGGRFSKGNVRKAQQSGHNPQRRTGGNQEPENKTNPVLVAIVVLLVIAIVLVLCYMAVRVFLPGLIWGGNGGDTDTPTQSIQQSQPDPIPCTDITLAKPSITFTAAGSGQLLSYVLQPSETTDPVTFTSSDPTVATVNEKGLVTAVSGGRAVITITCGEKKAYCDILCDFGGYTDPTDGPTEPTVNIPANFVLELKHKEITISRTYPDPVKLYKNNDYVTAKEITWTVDDPKVASVDENGVVSPVGKGYTYVRATVGNLTASCKVIVAFDPEPVNPDRHKLSHTDVTLTIGTSAQSFMIYLTDSEGVNVEAEWTASVEGYVTIKGKNITGIKSTYDQPERYITISATVDGEIYTCKIRVVEPAPEATQ